MKLDETRWNFLGLRVWWYYKIRTTNRANWCCHGVNRIHSQYLVRNRNQIPFLTLIPTRALYQDVSKQRQPFLQVLPLDVASFPFKLPELTVRRWLMARNENKPQCSLSYPKSTPAIPRAYQLSQSISAIPRAHQISPEHISYPKRISGVPEAYQVSHEHISYPKSISAIPRAHQLQSKEDISYPKNISAIQRTDRPSQEHISFPKSISYND